MPRVGRPFLVRQMKHHLDGNDPSNRANCQNAVLTIAWASRQCMLAQLSTSRTLCVTVEYSSDHLSVSSCLVTSLLVWFSLLANPLVFDTIHVFPLLFHTL